MINTSFGPIRPFYADRLLKYYCAVPKLIYGQPVSCTEVQPESDSRRKQNPAICVYLCNRHLTQPRSPDEESSLSAGFIQTRRPWPFLIRTNPIALSCALTCWGLRPAGCSHALQLSAIQDLASQAWLVIQVFSDISHAYLTPIPIRPSHPWPDSIRQGRGTIFKMKAERTPFAVGCRSKNMANERSILKRDA